METILPTDAIFSLLLSSNYNTILNLCQTSTMINNICQNDHFWYQKLDKNFGNFSKLVDKTWRQSYDASR